MQGSGTRPRRDASEWPGEGQEQAFGKASQVILTLRLELTANHCFLRMALPGGPQGQNYSHNHPETLLVFIFS